MKIIPQLVSPFFRKSVRYSAGNKRPNSSTRCEYGQNWWLITKLVLRQSGRMKCPHQLHSTSNNWLKKKRTSSSISAYRGSSGFSSDVWPTTKSCGWWQRSWAATLKIPKEIQRKRPGLRHGRSVRHVHIVVFPWFSWLPGLRSQDFVPRTIPTSYPGSFAWSTMQPIRVAVHLPKARFLAIWTHYHSWKLLEKFWPILTKNHELFPFCPGPFLSWNGGLGSLTPEGLLHSISANDCKGRHLSEWSIVICSWLQIRM